ncbi:MAG: 1-acyl-sn-glycerol-3-phosphate acyltransferase [Treponema sp.]|nr:1-acyl-sn-glycerol-3-phosphate acyltransferase [Treponema sp.]
MIKTILCFGFLIIAMILLVPFGLAAGFLYLLGLRKPMRHFIYFLAKMWALSIIKISRSKITVKGSENIPKKGSVCFISNHCGYFDIILLLAYCGRPFGFIAKKELIFVPFLNIWIHLLNGLFIDRTNIRKAIGTIKEGVKRIKAGGGMIIFPEGHRSKGRGLLPFHPGSLKLATMADAPIIPVAIEGSYGIFEKNMRVESVPVKIAFLEPVNTADLPPGDRKQALCDKIYSVISEELADGNEREE